MSFIDSSDDEDPFSSTRFSQLSLETSLLINSSNPTIVGAWDLDKPINAETSKRQLRGDNLETLSPDGDHRQLADGSSVNPPGQYKAICKLFLSFTDGKLDEYIGTGWLCEKDLIATAGHCVFDWNGKGAFLQYIKCYFGYNGPNSTGLYRYGISAACPAEYLKASSFVHDLGFVRLNAPVENVPLLKFSDTPARETARLGVVGYPGDRDGGKFLYEHWATVNIDLARTNTLLRYEIDTFGGQSGSPVLRKLANNRVDAIGVHVAGGFPNRGSVIGPIGNRFEEYQLAMNVKRGDKSPLATVMGLPSPSPLPLVKGFQMINVKSTSSNPLSISTGSIGASSMTTVPGREFDSALRSLFGDDPSTMGGETGNESKFRTMSIDSTEYYTHVASGKLTEYPEALKVPNRSVTDPSLPKVDYNKAFASWRDQNDVPTVFFVHLAATLDGPALEHQQKLMKMIVNTQAWMSMLCEGKVQQQVDDRKLPGDDKGQFARSTYRTQVLDYLFRNTTWLVKDSDQKMSKHVEVEKAKFHSEILSTMLEGYSVPSSAFTQLETVLRSIDYGIKMSSEKSSEPLQYWLMLTKYDWQPGSKTVRPVIRFIQFQVGQSAKQYVSNKTYYDAVKFDMNFSQLQCVLDEEVNSSGKVKMDEQLARQGIKIWSSRYTNVEISK